MNPFLFRHNYNQKIPYFFDESLYIQQNAVQKVIFLLHFIFSSSCVIYKIPKNKSLVNSFLHLLLTYFQYFNSVYFIFISFVKKHIFYEYFFVLYNWFFNNFRYTTTFFDRCISFTYKLSIYRFNDFHKYRYNKNSYIIHIFKFSICFVISPLFNFLNFIKLFILGKYTGSILDMKTSI